MQNILPLFDIDIHLDFCQISSLLRSVNEGLFGKLNPRYFAIIASFPCYHCSSMSVLDPQLVRSILPFFHDHLNSSKLRLFPRLNERRRIKIRSIAQRTWQWHFWLTRSRANWATALGPLRLLCTSRRKLPKKKKTETFPRTRCNRINRDNRQGTAVEAASLTSGAPPLNLRWSLGATCELYHKTVAYVPSFLLPCFHFWVGTRSIRKVVVVAACTHAHTIAGVQNRRQGWVA